MKNQILPGNTVTLRRPTPSSSGGGCLVGSLFGIAAYDAANARTSRCTSKAPSDMAKLSAQAWTVGALIYWDDTEQVDTTVSTSNKLIGVAVKVAANPSSTGRVRLNGAFMS
jgi:predicted RecA/RadA family phage recombinase